jgi:hypothetical protein
MVQEYCNDRTAAVLIFVVEQSLKSVQGRSDAISNWESGNLLVLGGFVFRLFKSEALHAY